MSRSNSKAVPVWLFTCCALIFTLIVLGGVTRLTHSGLSMVDWDPVMGAVPPLTEQDWRAAFERYKQFPEYQKVNRDMSLAGFKRIFYIEYAHRMLGRVVGLAFAVPLLAFMLSGRITLSMAPRFAAIFALGAAQGLMGWIMVQSGLVDRPSVSQYRLTAHLLLAVLIYAVILWSALSLWRGTEPRPGAGHRAGWLVLALVAVMIASGGFVAGTRAGFAYNTFPLMAGAWVPDGIWALSPGWRNLFENVATVQFVHRALAALLVLAVVARAAATLRRPPAGGQRLAAWLMLLAVLAQAALGVATLVHRVPLGLAAGHQAGAVVLLTLVLVHTHCLKYARESL